MHTHHLLRTFLALVRKLLWKAFFYYIDGMAMGVEKKRLNVIFFSFMIYNKSKRRIFCTKDLLVFLTFARASEPPNANTQNQYYKFHNFPFEDVTKFFLCVSVFAGRKEKLRNLSKSTPVKFQHATHSQCPKRKEVW